MSDLPLHGKPMIGMPLEEVRIALGGRWRGAPPAPGLEFKLASNDTRALGDGDVYVALKGARFDGHEFLKQAREAGAVAALINRSYEGELPAGLPCIEVEDTLKSFGDIARVRRESLHQTDFVAVAGSNGKTSTREMISAVLAKRGRVMRNQKNDNNLVGVPQTIFRVEPAHRYAVIELGTSLPGEIAQLTAMVRPSVAVLTNISEEHLEGLGSIEGVIEEEAAVFEHLTDDAIAVINYDDPNSMLARARARCRVVSYGFDDRCEIRASNVVVTTEGTEFRLNGKHAFKLKLHGRHNVYNALAAIAVGWIYGVSIDDMRAALGSIEPVAQRMQVTVINEVVVFNDTYNANPGSMRAALKTLNDFTAKKHRIVCLGDMLELGAASASTHMKLAWTLATTQIDLLVCVGPAMKLCGERVAEYGIPVAFFDSAEEAGAYLSTQLVPQDTLLVKGSRGMKMERAIEALKVS